MNLNRVRRVLKVLMLVGIGKVLWAIVGPDAMGHAMADSLVKQLGPFGLPGTPDVYSEVGMLLADMLRRQAIGGAFIGVAIITLAAIGVGELSRQPRQQPK